MERRVTVNDGIEPIELDPPEELASEGELASVNTGGSYGPCLYLGPTGERCSRPALEGGYCAKHHPDPALRPAARAYTRVLAATVALVIVVWPYIADFVRDVVRWLATH